MVKLGDFKSSRRITRLFGWRLIKWQGRSVHLPVPYTIAKLTSYVGQNGGLGEGSVESSQNLIIYLQVLQAVHCLAQLFVALFWNHLFAY